MENISKELLSILHNLYVYHSRGVFISNKYYINTNDIRMMLIDKNSQSQVVIYYTTYNFDINLILHELSLYLHEIVSINRERRLNEIIK